MVKIKSQSSQSTYHTNKLLTNSTSHIIVCSHTSHLFRLNQVTWLRLCRAMATCFIISRSNLMPRSLRRWWVSSCLATKFWCLLMRRSLVFCYNRFLILLLLVANSSRILHSWISLAGWRRQQCLINLSFLITLQSKKLRWSHSLILTVNKWLHTGSTLKRTKWTLLVITPLALLPRIYWFKRKHPLYFAFPGVLSAVSASMCWKVCTIQR